MAEIGHRFITTNGIKMHYAEAGSGPRVLLCHGLPESWYSWRPLLTALAEAGFHAIALDMRGYGQTEQPKEVEAYDKGGIENPSQGASGKKKYSGGKADALDLGLIPPPRTSPLSVR